MVPGGLFAPRCSVGWAQGPPGSTAQRDGRSTGRAGPDGGSVATREPPRGRRQAAPRSWLGPVHFAQRGPLRWPEHRLHCRTAEDSQHRGCGRQLNGWHGDRPQWTKAPRGAHTESSGTGPSCPGPQSPRRQVCRRGHQDILSTDPSSWDGHGRRGWAGGHAGPRGTDGVGSLRAVLTAVTF